MCALLSLAVYIESTANVSSSEFLYTNPNDGDRVVRRYLANMVKHDGFKKLKAGNIGTHSLRKGAATYATRSGISKGFVNRRGRWRTRKGVVDIYIDNTQPYPDAKTAAVLTGPAGPCFYTLRPGIGGVTTEFLVDQVAPTVKQVMGESIAATLALPLLWVAGLEAYEYALLPSKLQQKNLRAFANVGGNHALNPVVREEFCVTGDGSQLNLVVIDSCGNPDQPNNLAASPSHNVYPGSALGGEGSRREFAALYSQIGAGRRHTTEVLNEVLRLRRESQRELQKIQAILKRIAMQPAFRRNVNTQDIAATPPNPSTHQASTAVLSKRPKDLFELWHEYQIGCGDLKAAKDFTAIERGANKFAFSRRKVFWDVVASLVRSGFTSDAAIDKVYSVYGRQLSVSSILVALRADRKNGGHPRLRV
ncbi:hypothetical protein AM587_10003726 [Phytophthora nicotianae]|uniref:Uncharacterized protein n=1 Tax=Phytophthora nicotianae TaxID=4792 RepID=A0A0W8BVI8_PHYNI|nr:hypothetical protein AM587_10003726 [Phytophthora nicotianae]